LKFRVEVLVKRKSEDSLITLDDKPFSFGFSPKNGCQNALIQKLIPVVSLTGLVAGVLNQAFHLLDAHAVSGSCLRDNVLFHHDAAKIIGAVALSHLSDGRALRDPR
jgi:hypothetical protein